jgi:hypothetical protein
VNYANVKICGISYDGGYQEYMVAPAEALAQMTESRDPAEAAPLMCAGVTTFKLSLRLLTPFERTAPILAVRPASRRLSTKVRIFIEHLEKTFAHCSQFNPRPS